MHAKAELVQAYLDLVEVLVNCGRVPVQAVQTFVESSPQFFNL